MCDSDRKNLKRIDWGCFRFYLHTRKVLAGFNHKCESCVHHRIYFFVVLVSANSLVVVIDCLSVGVCAGWSLLSLWDSLCLLLAPPTRLPSSFPSHRVYIPR